MQLSPVCLALPIGLTLALKWSEQYGEKLRVTFDEVAGEIEISHGSVHPHHSRSDAVPKSLFQVVYHKRLVRDLKECGEDICEALYRV